MNRTIKLTTLLALLAVGLIGSISNMPSVFADSAEIYADLRDPAILKESLVEGEPAFSCTKKITYTYPYPVNKEQVNTYHCKNARLKYIPVSEEGVTPKRTQVAGWLENKMGIADNKQYNYRAACSFPYWYNGQKVSRINGPDSTVACNVTSSYDWHSAAYDFATPVTQEMLVEAAKNKQSEATIATWGFSWETPAWEGGSQRIVIMLDLNSTYLYGLDGDTSKPLFDPEIAGQLAEGKDPFSPKPDPDPDPEPTPGPGDKHEGEDSGDKGDEEDSDNTDEGDGTLGDESNNQNDADGSSNSDNQPTPKAPDTGENLLNQNNQIVNNLIGSLGVVLVVSSIVALALYRYRHQD